MRLFLLKHIFLLLLLLPYAVSAESEVLTKGITGKVVRVADGDTITILDSKKQQHRVRLIAIDCPESKQAFGQKAKEYLSKLCFGKEVGVSWRNKDRYGRILGVVSVGGVNCNEEMLKAGLAWHYRKYSKDKTLQTLEDAAKKAGKGLWADPKSVAPWDFRRKKK
jgi:micrococcal nuclease